MRLDVFELKDKGDIEMQRSAQAVARPEMFATAPVEPAAILGELFELLEDYAPTWYTEELHHRAATALGKPVYEPCLP